MRKLSLELDALAVESFGADEAPEARGTVRANEALADTGTYSCYRTCYCPSHHRTECCGII